jgi:hypothetical protein
MCLLIRNPSLHPAYPSARLPVITIMYRLLNSIGPSKNHDQAATIACLFQAAMNEKERKKSVGQPEKSTTSNTLNPQPVNPNPVPTAPPNTLLPNALLPAAGPEIAGLFSTPSSPASASPGSPTTNVQLSSPSPSSSSSRSDSPDPSWLLLLAELPAAEAAASRRVWFLPALALIRLVAYSRSR